MDPIIAIGTVGAIANIISGVSRIIKSLRNLCDHWKDVDFTILNLITQLTALAAALSKIQEWIDSDLADVPQHHQLVMDLDLSITCCRMLINKLDAHVSELDGTTDSTPDVRSKIRVVFGAKASEDMQKLIERQIGALTLLLAACNCKNTSEQRVLLEKSSSRKVLNKVKDDSSSLFVLRDTTSFYSRWTKYTDNSSKLSIIFSFDRELFVSKVYERAMRGFAKESIRRCREVDMGLIESFSTSHMTKSNLGKQQKRSETIDRELNEFRKMMEGEIKVLLLGGADGAKETIMRQIKVIHGNSYSLEDLASYRDTVRMTALKAMCSALEGLKKSGFKIKDEYNQNCAATLLQRYQSDQKDMDVAVGKLISNLWHSLGDVMSDGAVNIPDNAPYFFEEINRIALPDYIPNEVDILRLPDAAATQGIDEVQLTVSEMNIRIVSVGTWQPRELRKWIHQFENVDILLFAVDLCSYDQLTPSTNLLMESRMLFDSVVNSRWFNRTPIILLFTNFHQFKQKVARDPLHNYYSDYNGGNNIKRSTSYILELFISANRNDRRVYTLYIDLADTSWTREMFILINESVIRETLRALNLLD